MTEQCRHAQPDVLPSLKWALHGQAAPRYLGERRRQRRQDAGARRSLSHGFDSNLHHGTGLSATVHDLKEPRLHTSFAVLYQPMTWTATQFVSGARMIEAGTRTA